MIPRRRGGAGRFVVLTIKDGTQPIELDVFIDGVTRTHGEASGWH